MSYTIYYRMTVWFEFGRIKQILQQKSLLNLLDVGLFIYFQRKFAL